MFICAYCFLGLELGCFICAYFPFSRFGIRLCSFVPIFHFLGLELGSRFGIRLCSFVPIFRFLGLELGCVHLCLLFSRFGIRLFHLCLFSIFSVWN